MTKRKKTSLKMYIFRTIIITTTHKQNNQQQRHPVISITCLIPKRNVSDHNKYITNSTGWICKSSYSMCTLGQIWNTVPSDKGKGIRILMNSHPDYTVISSQTDFT